MPLEISIPAPDDVATATSVRPRLTGGLMARSAPSTAGAPSLTASGIESTHSAHRTRNSSAIELPRVSVLMLTYQHAKYVRESVESVLAQNYPNLQIVIGDDASTDGTQDILREYAARHPGLFKLLLAETNQGITKNANQTF